MTLTGLIQNYPIYSLVVICAIVTFLSTIATKYLTDQEHLRALKERQKELQEKIKKHKDNISVIQEAQSEIMQISLKMMKSSFKPLFVTAIPFLIIFYWMRNIFGPLISGTFLKLPIWVWYYIGFSLVCSVIFRKLMKVA